MGIYGDLMGSNGDFMGINGGWVMIWWLVGGLEHDFCSHILAIIPTDFHFFSEGWNHQPGYLLKSHFDDYVIMYYKTVNVKKNDDEPLMGLFCGNQFCS